MGMEAQETKFSFVYHEVKQRILTNQIPPGDYMPSSRILCHQFNVSRYTINRVFEALQKEGYIEIKPRIAPIVLPREAVIKQGTEGIDILRSRDNILQLYQTFALILPSLLSFAAKHCNLEILYHYKKAMKVSRMGISAGGWRPVSNLLKEILTVGGSPLLGNLYSVFELHSHLSFFTENSTFFLKVLRKDSIPITANLISILKEKDTHVMYTQLTHLLHKFVYAVQETLQHLADTLETYPLQSPAAFSWRPTRGKDYFYTRIVSDLNRRIGRGDYPRGTFLPSEKQLAAIYNVSVSTIRKALTELSQRGFVKTINGKGTMIITPDDTRVRQILPNPGRTEEALRYLHALQLLALIIHPATVNAAAKFKKRELKSLEEKLYLPDSICIIDIFEAILYHTDAQPLKSILEEAFRLTEWGHYIAYYDHKKQVLQTVNKGLRLAVHELHTGDYIEFANRIADCYYHIFQHARDIMTNKYGFSSAASIQLPEKYY